MRSLWVYLVICCLCSACGGGSDNSSSNNIDFADPSNLDPSSNTSPYAGVLSGCLSPSNDSDSCLLSDLPLIAQKGATVTADAVMEQTLVSHDWMADRWEAVLPLLPDDILQLLGSTTGVVIAGDIRPSFYTTQTGAINLDAAYFWLTNAEKADIDQAPDFRSGFGDGLQFIMLSRYVRDDDYAWDSYALDGVEERQLQDLIEPLSALLFHELAHANDFFPKSEISSVRDTNTVSQEASRLSGSRLSTELTDFSPLQSDLLGDIAQVLFLGANASTSMLLLTPEDVALEFSNDVANDDYAYSNQFEDLAMLFEEIMMKHHFDIDRDIAYTDRPGDDSRFCIDYPVRWGQRGRIGDPSVKARASYLLQRLLNQNNVSAYVNDLSAPRAMINGNDWCQNIDLSAISAKLSKPSSSSTTEFPAADRLHPFD